MENIEIAAKNALDAIRDYNNLLIESYCECGKSDRGSLDILTQYLDLISAVNSLLDAPNPFLKQK